MISMKRRVYGYGYEFKLWKENKESIYICKEFAIRRGELNRLLEEEEEKGERNRKWKQRINYAFSPSSFLSKLVSGCIHRVFVCRLRSHPSFACLLCRCVCVSIRFFPSHRCSAAGRCCHRHQRCHWCRYFAAVHEAAVRHRSLANRETTLLVIVHMHGRRIHAVAVMELAERVSANGTRNDDSENSSGRRNRGGGRGKKRSRKGGERRSRSSNSRRIRICIVCASIPCPCPLLLVRVLIDSGG